MDLGLSKFIGKAREYDIFVLRLGLGLTMALGWGFAKLLAGPERWTQLGGAMASYGITFAPVFWGFMAMFAEFFCATLIALGLFTRWSSLLLGFTMLTVIVARHLPNLMAFEISKMALPLLFLIMCIVLVLSGGGNKLNLERKIFGREF